MNGAQKNRSVAGALIGLVMVLLSGGIGTTGPTLGGSSASTGVLDRTDRITKAVDGLIAQLTKDEEGSRSGYDRELFPHWSDLDGNGCDAREDVLIDEAEAGTVEDCSVLDGRWFSIYDGLERTSASLLDIDHMVPLAEAWDSGASVWTTERRERYANDLGYADSLIAVTRSSNRSKGDRDPAEWMPTNTEIWCRYATAWVTVKVRWALSADAAEIEALKEMFETCEHPPRTEVDVANGA